MGLVAVEGDRPEVQPRHVEAGVGQDQALVEEHLLHEHRERRGGQGQVEALEAEGGQGDEGAHQTAHGRGQEQPPDGAAAAEVAHDHRPDAGEGQRGQVDLAPPADEGDQGQHDDPDAHAEAELVEAQVRQQGARTGGQQTEDDGGDDPTAQRRHRDVLPRLLLTARPHPQRRDAQQDDEEQDHREGRAEPTEGDRGEAVPAEDRGDLLVRVEVAHGVGLTEAEDQGAHEGEGQAAQPTDHGRGVGVDHQQREVQVLEDALAARQEDPREGGQ